MIDCQNNDCNARVTKQFARVYGDNNNKVHACPSCVDNTNIKRGAAAGHERPRGSQSRPPPAPTHL